VRGREHAETHRFQCRSFELPSRTSRSTRRRETAGREELLWVLRCGQNANDRKFPSNFCLTGGRGEIRTHEGAEPPAGFQDRCLKPLGHPSKHLMLFIFHSILPARKGLKFGRFLPFFYRIFPAIAAFSAASSLATASSCIPGMTCEYRSKVMPTLEWPSRSLAILG
jgi:hypothetical protein